MKRTIGGFLIASVGALVAAPQDARAATPSFAGKSITMIIPSTPGGGTDTTGRAIGAFLADHLPGKPSLVIRNMPGANGMTALNFFVRQVEADGFTLTMGSSSQADPVHYRTPQAFYNPSDFEIIGGAGRGGTVLMINTDALARLRDPKAAPVVMGSLVGVPRSGMLSTAWGIEFLGWNAKWVVGYPGTNDLMLALSRGEIDMTSTGNMFQIAKFLSDGKFKVLSQSGALENGAFVAREDFGGAPLFHEQMKGKIRDEVAAKGFAYWSSLTAIDKWLALPAKTPKPVVEVYREAFKAATKDPRFAEKGKTLSEDFEPMSHEDVKMLLTSLSDTPLEATDYINKMLRKQGLDPGGK
jgi:tripartite-type tricarboxylate transporter receptor subunit TctC